MKTTQPKYLYEYVFHVSIDKHLTIVGKNKALVRWQDESYILAQPKRVNGVYHKPVLFSRNELSSSIDELLDNAISITDGPNRSYAYSLFSYSGKEIQAKVEKYSQKAEKLSLKAELSKQSQELKEAKNLKKSKIKSKGIKRN